MSKIDEETLNKQITEIVEKIKELYTLEKSDMGILTDNLIKMDARLKLLETTPKQDDSPQIESMVNEIQSINLRIAELNGMVIKLAELVQKFAVEKSLIEPPKPKTVEEQIAEVTKELKGAIQTNQEKAITTSKYEGYCFVCRGPRIMNAVEEKDTQYGRMATGVCCECGSKMSKKIKK